MRQGALSSPAPAPTPDIAPDIAPDMALGLGLGLGLGIGLGLDRGAAPANAPLAWLAIAEALDERARAIELVWQFARALPSRPHLLDLGAGTGGNVRHLLPRLGRRQQDWTVMEARFPLFSRLEGEMERWARQHGWGVSHNGTGPLLFGDDLRCQIAPTALALDITRNRGLHHLGVQRHDGVSCHHFLHTLSQRWLDDFVIELNSSGKLPLLATGLPDGMPRWSTPDPDDALIAEALIAPPDPAVGDEPALGLGAARAVLLALQGAGYKVDGARSDWRVDGMRHPQRLGALIDAMAGMAAHSHPDEQDRAQAWRHRRREALAGTALLIPHLDLLAHH